MIKMESKYTGSSKELEEAKSKGITGKAKKYIASALMAGSLMVSGTPAYAYNDYTQEELSHHYEKVKEVKNMYDNIINASSDVLNQAYENRKISKEKYEHGLNNIEKFESQAERKVNNLKTKFQNIKDKNLIYMKILATKEGDTKPRVELNLNNITSLNKEQIEAIEKKYNINSIALNRYYEVDRGIEAERQFVYSLETYKKMLDVMDEKFGDLKNNKNLTDLEKVTIVLKRIENIKYDHAALELSDLKNPKVNTSRSMEDPLLNNTGICGGYTDLFKNTMSYLGIESREIRGHVDNAYNPNTLPGEPNHAWNQVKINNKWYNLDITAMTQNKDILKPNKSHPYLFTSDSELNAERSNKKQHIIASLLSHRETYTPILGSHEKAKESLSEKEIDVALNKAIEYEKNLYLAKNKASSKRSKFLAELSNNNKYKNLEINNYTNTNSKNKSTKDEEHERL